MSQSENEQNAIEMKEMWGGCSMCSWTSVAMIPEFFYSELYANNSTTQIDVQVLTTMTALMDDFDLHNASYHQETARFIFLRDQTPKSQ